MNRVIRERRVGGDADDQRRMGRPLRRSRISPGSGCRRPHIRRNGDEVCCTGLFAEYVNEIGGNHAKIGNRWIAKKNGLSRFVQAQKAAVPHPQIQRCPAGAAGNVGVRACRRGFSRFCHSHAKCRMDGKRNFCRHWGSGVGVKKLHLKGSRLSHTGGEGDGQACQPARQHKPIAAACVDAGVQPGTLGHASDADKQPLSRLAGLDTDSERNRLSRRRRKGIGSENFARERGGLRLSGRTVFVGGCGRILCGALSVRCNLSGQGRHAGAVHRLDEIRRDEDHKLGLVALEARRAEQFADDRQIAEARRLALVVFGPAILLLKSVQLSQKSAHCRSRWSCRYGAPRILVS